MPLGKIDRRMEIFRARRKPPRAPAAPSGREGEVMKSQLLKGVTMLVSIIAVAFVTALISGA
jgi:hypothetical protein